MSKNKEKIISADKMMNKAKGPVWHQKDRKAGIIPSGLRGLDKDATWGKSRTCGWVYGHGSFSIVTHKTPVLGVFVHIRNSGNEAKRMWLETCHYTGMIDFIAMDSKADDFGLYRELKRQRKMNLITSCRKNMDKSENRKEMSQFMKLEANRKIYKQRAYRVEPMQGLVKDIFELDRCWMRGDKNNRWLFAAMGLTIQMHQLQAYKENKSTWNIKTAVLE